MLITPQNPIPDDELAARWRALRARIGAAARAAARNEEQVTLVAVSKGQSAARIHALARLGQEHFGENYLQEALPKLEALAGHELTWHFIGRLQANKTRPVAEHFAWVHGVERLQLAERLSAQRPHYAPALNVCLQVNIAGDAAKAGVAAAEVGPLAQAVHALPRLTLRGLMCMLPAGLPPPAHAEHYGELRALLARLQAEGLPLDTLSMGMSDDFEAAVTAGATLVRIGTALFGPRDR